MRASMLSALQRRWGVTELGMRRRSGQRLPEAPPRRDKTMAATAANVVSTAHTASLFSV